MVIAQSRAVKLLEQANSVALRSIVCTGSERKRQAWVLTSGRTALSGVDSRVNQLETYMGRQSLGPYGSHLRPDGYCQGGSSARCKRCLASGERKGSCGIRTSPSRTPRFRSICRMSFS